MRRLSRLVTNALVALGKSHANPMATILTRLLLLGVIMLGWRDRNNVVEADVDDDDRLLLEVVETKRMKRGRFSLFEWYSRVSRQAFDGRRPDVRDPFRCTHNDHSIENRRRREKKVAPPFELKVRSVALTVLFRTAVVVGIDSGT
jgi:hypothetical protein